MQPVIRKVIGESHITIEPCPETKRLCAKAVRAVRDISGARLRGIAVLELVAHAGPGPMRLTADECRQALGTVSALLLRPGDDRDEEGLLRLQTFWGAIAYVRIALRPLPPATRVWPGLPLSFAGQLYDGLASHRQGMAELSVAGAMLLYPALERAGCTAPGFLQLREELERLTREWRTSRRAAEQRMEASL